MEGSTRLRLLLFLFGLILLVSALLYIASFTDNNKQPPSTANPTTETFTNPFAQEETNPFVTESSYQNPFDTTASGGQEYNNPFESLK